MHESRLLSISKTRMAFPIDTHFIISCVLYLANSANYPSLESFEKCCLFWEFWSCLIIVRNTTKKNSLSNNRNVQACMNILASHFDETKPFIDPPLNAQDIVVENPITYSYKVGLLLQSMRKPNGMWNCTQECLCILLFQNLLNETSNLRLRIRILTVIWKKTRKLMFPSLIWILIDPPQPFR